MTSISSSPRVWCSTPEGIETVISTTNSFSRSERVVLNARRHRDGDQIDDDPAAILYECSTPEGIETVIRWMRALPSINRVVLNARRHRDGDQFVCASYRFTKCSTPEGIETVIDGLPPDSIISHVCSTPEGIETVIRSGTAKRVVVALVLNARRHRDGDQLIAAESSFGLAGCSTPEGIETVISRDVADDAAFQIGCSTPEGIETVIRRCHRAATEAGHRAQRPKASRR